MEYSNTLNTRLNKLKREKTTLEQGITRALFAYMTNGM